MILLDTNVISEFMGTPPNPAVVSWLDRQAPAHVYVSAISVSEILTGLAALPRGRRRQGLERDWTRFRVMLSQTQILAFDEAAAVNFAAIASARRQEGRPVDRADSEIAAIAMVHGFAVATRNIRDFEDMGVTLINPFTAD